MKIDKSIPLTRTPSQEQGKVGAKSQNTEKAPAAVSPSVVAHLNQLATDGSKDIDSVRVNELQTAIREGRLEIDASKIADKLITNVQDMLTKDSE